jgi:HEAT repeat protein
MNLGMKGTLVSAAYASERAGSLLLGFEVTGIEMESDQEMNRGQRDLLSESMRHEVFARITPRGRFEQLWFPPEMVSQARDLAREIILRTQVILPETPVASWKTMEEDVTGLFEAGYEGRGGKLGGKDILEISRRKISYVTINSVGTGGSKDIPTDPSGKTTAIVMLEEGWLRDLHSSEGLKAGGESYMARITKKTEAGLLFRKIWNDPDRAKRSALQLARRLSTMHASSPIGLENAEENAEMRRRERLESVAGGKSFQQVLNEMLLPLYQSGSLQGSDASRIRRILAAIFELDPAQVADALSRMKSGTVPVDVMAMIATAFGQAGTPSAQTALVELINDEQMDPKVRMPALLAMVSPRSPTVEAQKALQALVDPNDPRGLGANTLLVLGAMTKNLNRFGGEGADDMVAFLLDQESSFREAGNTEVFLSAIGNAGDDRGFDAVTGYLGDPSEDVRASAVDALSGMTHKGVSALLVQALGDGKERVQVRAIRGLKLQAYTSTTSASVGAVLSSSPSVYVRKAALRYFQKHAAENPGAMEAIRLAASNDVDENVRKMAQDLIR